MQRYRCNEVNYNVADMATSPQCVSDGARLIMARHLPKFISLYPEVEIEISVDDRMVDMSLANHAARLFYCTVAESLARRSTTADLFSDE